MLGFSVDESKILFLKEIYQNQKLQQDLILFDSGRQETHQYRFNNPFLYSRKKKKLISQYQIIEGIMFGSSVESEMVKHPRLPADLLFLKDGNSPQLDSRPLLPSLQIFLDNDRERYLLGKVVAQDFLLYPIKIDQMFLSSEGRLVVFVLSYFYQENNLIQVKKEIVGFDLYPLIIDPINKVTAAQQFNLSTEQNALSFQKNFYYNESDGFLFSETLYHSGFRKIEGTGYSVY